MDVPKIAKLNRGTKRRPNYYARYTVHGKRYLEPTHARTEAEFHAYVKALDRKFRSGSWQPPKPGARNGVLTFDEWAPLALAKRIEMGVKTAAKDEASIIANHLIPMFGKTPLDEVTFALIVEQFAELKSKGLAGATVRNIHMVFAAVMRLASKAEHIANPPPRLTALDGELPPLVDKRPEGWRETAKFNREEIAALITCDEVELQYRVMYVVYFLTGSRFKEVTTLRVRSFDPDVEPLPSLTVRAVKQRRDKGPMYRVCPVHPVLRAWLTWWLREGYELVHLRKPKPDDYLFPTCSVRRKNLGLEDCSHGEIYKRWARHHLPGAKLAHRRLHDARRTFISIARSARVDKDLVRAITHRATADTVLDSYTTFEWDKVCAELAKIDFRLPGPPSSEAVVVNIGTYVRRPNHA